VDSARRADQGETTAQTRVADLTNLFNINIRVQTRAEVYRFGMSVMLVRIRRLNVRALRGGTFGVLDHPNAKKIFDQPM
jgi:hypothetical protein